MVKATVRGSQLWHERERLLDCWHNAVQHAKEVMDWGPGRDSSAAIEETIHYIETTELDDLIRSAERSALALARREFRVYASDKWLSFRSEIEHAPNVVSTPAVLKKRYGKVGFYPFGERMPREHADRVGLYTRREMRRLSEHFVSAPRTSWQGKSGNIRASWESAGAIGEIGAEKLISAWEQFYATYCSEMQRCRDELRGVLDSFAVDPEPEPPASLWASINGKRRRVQVKRFIETERLAMDRFMEAAAAIEMVIASIGAENAKGSAKEAATDLASHRQRDCLAFEFDAEFEVEFTRFMFAREAISRVISAGSIEGSQPRYWDRFNDVIAKVNASVGSGELDFLFSPEAADVLGPQPSLQPDGTIIVPDLGFATTQIPFAPTLPDPENQFVAWVERVNDVLRLRAGLVEAGLVESTEMRHPFGPPPDPAVDAAWSNVRATLIREVHDRTFRGTFTLVRWKGRSVDTYPPGSVGSGEHLVVDDGQHVSHWYPRYFGPGPHYTGGFSC